MDNLSYLFWAHVICWAGLFMYIYWLARKNEGLRKEIEALKRANSRTGEQGAGWQSEGVR